MNVERSFLRLTAVVSAVIPPDPLLLPKLIGLAAGAAAVPWIVFFVFRWIIRGFGSA